MEAAAEVAALLECFEQKQNNLLLGSAFYDHLDGIHSLAISGSNGEDYHDDDDDWPPKRFQLIRFTFKSMRNDVRAMIEHFSTNQRMAQSGRALRSA